MDSDARRRFKQIDLKLSKHEEQLIKHDRQLLAIRNLLYSGMQLMVNLETKIDALTDSHIKLYGTGAGTRRSTKGVAGVLSALARGDEKIPRSSWKRSPVKLGSPEKPRPKPQFR